MAEIRRIRIGLYHGYELTGSGSNEYVRYLARFLLALGHEVHIICREERPEQFDWFARVVSWNADGTNTVTPGSNPEGKCTLHQLPHSSVRPVYVTDKQRKGNVKTFIELTEDELTEYHTLNETLLTRILTDYPMDVLHANHLVYQPIAAVKPCQETGTKLIIYPHGSSIEYIVRHSEKFYQLALQALLAADQIIIGNQEVTNRIYNLYPEHAEAMRSKIQIVGVGVDISIFVALETSRNSRVALLSNYQGPPGKTPQQLTDLRTELDNGDLYATRRYWDAYDHSVPDSNLIEIATALDWDNSKVILFVGAFTSGKGIQSLLAALPAVFATQQTAHLVLVGSGAYREVLEGFIHAISTGNQGLIAQFVERGMSLDRNDLQGGWDDIAAYLAQGDNLTKLLSQGQGMANRVTFLGRMDHDLLQYVFHCADVAVFPSVVPEAYPLVLMESLANGVIPVVSYFSGFADGIDELEGELGAELTGKMRINMDTELRVQSIVDNLKYVLHFCEENQHGPKLRAIAVERYDWAIRARQMTDAYCLTLESPNP